MRNPLHSICPYLIHFLVAVQTPRHVVIYKMSLTDFDHVSDVVCDFTDSAWNFGTR